MATSDQTLPAPGLAQSGSWVLYDVANTIYSAAITYLLAPFVRDTFHDVTNLGLAQTISMILSGLAVPVFAAIADQTGRARGYLVVTTLIAVGAMFAWGVASSFLLLMLLFGIANFAYNSALVFYNSLLPSVSTPKNEGLISGIGVGLGYLGTFLTIFVLVVNEDALGTQFTFILGALMFLVLSLPCFLLVRDRRVTNPRPFSRTMATRNLKRVYNTIRKLKHDRQTFWFLVGNFFCVDVLNTAIMYFVLYALAVYSAHEFSIFGMHFDMRLYLEYGHIDERFGNAEIFQPDEASFKTFVGASLIGFALVMGLVIGWLADRWGSVQSMRMSALCLVVAVTCGVIFVGQGPESWELKEITTLTLHDSQSPVERKVLEGLIDADLPEGEIGNDQRAALIRDQLNMKEAGTSAESKLKRWQVLAKRMDLSVSSAVEDEAIQELQKSQLEAREKKAKVSPELAKREVIPDIRLSRGEVSNWNPTIFVLTIVFFGAIGLAGIWTAGRKVLLDIAPRKRLGEYFGLYGITVKVSVIGSTVFAVMMDDVGARWAMAAIGLPLLVGIYCLYQVKPLNGEKRVER